MEYKVEYWFRTKHDDMDSEIVTVEANSEEEAIEKAKSEAIRGSKNFKIMKESNEFGRMQELAGINNENSENLSLYEVEIGIPSGTLVVEVRCASDDESDLHDAAIDELISEINVSSKLREWRKLS